MGIKLRAYRPLLYLFQCFNGSATLLHNSHDTTESPLSVTVGTIIHGFEKINVLSFIMYQPSLLISNIIFSLKVLAVLREANTLITILLLTSVKK